MIKNRISVILSVLIVLLLVLAGCNEQAEQADVTTYHVIGGGEKTVETINKPSYADFYIPEGLVTAFGSSLLTPEEKRIYDRAREDLGHFKEMVYLPTDAVTYTKILELIRFEELSFFPLKDRSIGDYDAGAGAFEVYFKYYSDNTNANDTMTRINMEIEAAAKAIMAEITPDMTDYDKLKFFHDWLIKNCKTDDSNPTDIYSSTIYGTLINKVALCEGYAKTFSYLCNLAGIENVIVAGVVNLPHMWNMVRLDGNWYHIDVTYDFADENVLFTHPEFISYQYFLVSDAVIENNHIIDKTIFEPPSANSMKENYFVRERLTVFADSKTDEVIAHALSEAVKAKRGYAVVKFDSTDLYMNAVNKISSAGGFDAINSAVIAETGEIALYSTSDYYSDYRILLFFIQYNNSD
ncbi:MAG: hypothetical protein LBM41_03285 [Ruminococcus sp.]|nr:hypothetical protein [Ruminococcus sp.]